MGGEAVQTDITTEHIERLITAAGSHGVTGAIKELGVARTGSIVIDELVFRCEPPRNRHAVPVRIDLVHGTEKAVHVLRLADGEPVTSSEEAPEDACVRLEFDLAELVTLVYGVPRERSAGVHRSELLLAAWPRLTAAYGISDHELMGSVQRAVDSVLGGLSHRRPSLNELAVRYGSDKWSVIHWFTPHYDRHLRDLRNEPVRVLEIGIGGYAEADSGGESLQMWKRYFPRGLVLGVDIVEKHGLDAARLRTVRGDQSDRAFLASIAEQHGPFDVIIDDGSHVNEHVLATFDALFPHLRSGGFYVVEDLWTAYCPGFGGDDENLDNPGTSLGLLKGIIDRIHHEERDGADPDHVARNTVGLHVYHNIAFIQKGVNAEGRIPAWIPRSSDEINPR
ncbi:class I SAM-dependent methyltransferase [Streptoverticillium reticulum]|uniref:class I SAM-dependent methyltransferase n=1 Tax=Streptoverticillium reticulum TaxID=1433415 RepID=UPI0039BF42C6